MPSEEYPRTMRWKTMMVIATLVAPLFTVLWLGITLTPQNASLPVAMAKIVFAMIAVGAGILGTRWPTASGVILGLQALVAISSILLKIDAYEPESALRTTLLLVVPLATASVLLILADGIKAGTWPPARFNQTM